jgi:predicted SnoaL-like aldol condensation-catalyzing enzyme
MKTFHHLASTRKLFLALNDTIERNSSMSAEKNKATDRRFYEELINRKNLAIIDELADEDFVSHFISPGLPPGREGFKIFVSVFLAAFPDWHLTVDEMMAEGDLVSAHMTF